MLYLPKNLTRWDGVPPHTQKNNFLEINHPDCFWVFSPYSLTSNDQDRVYDTPQPPPISHARAYPTPTLLSHGSITGIVNFFRLTFARTTTKREKTRDFRRRLLLPDEARVSWPPPLLIRPLQRNSAAAGKRRCGPDTAEDLDHTGLAEKPSR
jgi:hypothetical protein